jgi:MtrB/PioB family decaheme-associated outer membrane protein
MKTQVIIFGLILSLIPFSNAFSEEKIEEKIIEGEISATGKYVGVEGEEGGKAKFTEYSDLKEEGGFYGRARLNLDTESYFLNLKAGDFGYDTQYYKIDGGMWGHFKFDLFYNEIPHNITFDARTFFLGAGSDTLIGAPNTNVATWDKFDYSYERRQYGGGLKVNRIKPFFFDASFQREEREGIRPTGAAAVSPGGIAIELPEPVDYTTNNLKLEGGYAKNPLFLSFKYLYSDFNNSNTALHFINPAIGPDTFSLPPDNTYHKGVFKGGIKLPFNSRFSTNIGFAKGKSETSITDLLTPGLGFEGRVDTRNYDLVLTSNPVSFLDAKGFYKYYKRDNETDPFPAQSLGIIGLPLLVQDFLNYEVENYGGEIGLRLPARLYLTGGYQYVKTEREFITVGEAILDPDLATLVLPHDKDDIYSAELKWSGLDFMEIRVGYERLNRDAQEKTPEARLQLNKMYAYASQDRDTFKAAIDVFPLENLTFGFEYRHRKADYPDTTFGLKKDERDEFASSAAYTLGKMAKLYGNVDIGLIKFQPDLVRTEDPNDFPWEAKQKDRTFAYGLGTEIYAIPNKLTFVIQHDYLKSNGKVDFTIDPALLIAANGLGGANNEVVDIMRSEDYTLYSFKIKAIYHLTKSLIASLGYAYERFSYRDDQLDGYQFVNPPGGPVAGSNGAYLTGAYKDQSYKANVVFAGLTYKF